MQPESCRPRRDGRVFSGPKLKTGRGERFTDGSQQGNRIRPIAVNTKRFRGKGEDGSREGPHAPMAGDFESLRGRLVRAENASAGLIPGHQGSVWPVTPVGKAFQADRDAGSSPCGGESASRGGVELAAGKHLLHR